MNHKFKTKNHKFLILLILGFFLITFIDCNGQDKKKYYVQIDSTNFDDLKSDQIDYIEIYKLIDSDSTDSNHPKKLTKEQFEILNLELKKSVITTLHDPSNYKGTEYSIEVVYKDKSNRRFYTYSNIIEEEIHNQNNREVKDRIINNKVFFNTLWDKAHEELCDCPIIINLSEIDSIPKEFSKPYYMIDSLYYQQKESLESEFHVGVGIIKKDSGNYFLLAPYNLPLMWFPKTKLIYTSPRNYGSLLYLMEQPSKKSKEIAKIPWLGFIEVTVQNCYKGWIKISINWEDKIYTGWIEFGSYCSNPITTCN